MYYRKYLYMQTYMVVFICALAKVEFLISNEAEQKGMGFITIEVQSDPTAKMRITTI